MGANVGEMVGMRGGGGQAGGGVRGVTRIGDVHDLPRSSPWASKCQYTCRSLAGIGYLKRELTELAAARAALTRVARASRNASVRASLGADAVATAFPVMVLIQVAVVLSPLLSEECRHFRPPREGVRRSL